jgi:hypothetical protein
MEPLPNGPSINASSSVIVNPSASTSAAIGSSYVCTGAFVRVTVAASASSKAFVSGVSEVCAASLSNSNSLRTCPANTPLDGVASDSAACANAATGPAPIRAAAVVTAAIIVTNVSLFSCNLGALSQLDT